MAVASNYRNEPPRNNEQRNQQTPQSQEPISRETGYVTVASKLPLSLILRLDNMLEVAEPVMGGGQRLVQMAEKKAEVTINGVATRHGEAPSCRIVSGYALTPNISAKFWEEWFAKNADSNLIKNGIVFAYEKPEDLYACAKTHAKVQTGIQPLEPEKDSRAPIQIEKGDKKTFA